MGSFFQLPGLTDPLGIGSGIGYNPDRGGFFGPPSTSGVGVTPPLATDSSGGWLTNLTTLINTVGTNVASVYRAINPPSATAPGPSTLPASASKVSSGLEGLTPLLVLGGLAFLVVFLVTRK